MNIILVDRGSWFVDIILENTDWNIVFLISDNKEKYINNNRVHECYTFEEFLKIEDITYIDYQELMKYKSVQYINESGFRRIFDDYQLNRFDYYTGISVWLHIFHKYKLDFVLIVDFLHGFRCDYILQEICLKNKIKCYNIMPSIYNTLIIFDSQQGRLIKRDNVGKIDITKSMFYSNKINYDNTYKKNKYIYIKKILYKIGGIVLIRVISSLYKRRLMLEINYRKYTIFGYLFNWFRLKYLLNRVEKECIKVKFDSKYIVYFMHFEPEAVLTGNAIAMDSQLIAIKILSETVPNDWKVYVKVHPDMYKVNTEAFEYFIPSMYTFGGADFYNKIINFKNVYMISHKINSSDLMKHAMGISTMIGSVALEAAKYNKPVLLFAAQKSIYGYEKDFFCIESTKMCKEAIEKIQNGFIPQYTNFTKICNNYLFNNNNMDKKIIIDSILKNIY